MNLSALELLKSCGGTSYTNEKGKIATLDLLPPVFGQEIGEVRAMIPCPLPEEMRELLAFSKGFDRSPLGLVDLTGLDEQGYEFDEFKDIFPGAVPIAHDGFGNHWIVDLMPSSTAWCPIFYVSHDPPVAVFPSPTLSHFIEGVIRMATSPEESPIRHVSDRASKKIWKENPGLLSVEEALQSGDAAMKSFAGTLDRSYLIADLRDARPGDGFSWGRYGPRTRKVRCGEERIFAYQRRSILKRLLPI